VTSPYSRLGSFLVDHVMARFNWSWAGIVYESNLGVRAMQLGKSKARVLAIQAEAIVVL